MQLERADAVHVRLLVWREALDVTMHMSALRHGAQRCLVTSRKFALRDDFFAHRFAKLRMGRFPDPRVC